VKAFHGFESHAFLQVCGYSLMVELKVSNL
jgi:hypothetical protein